MSIIHKLIYKFNVIQANIIAHFFVYPDQLTWKYTGKYIAKNKPKHTWRKGEKFFH